MKKKYKIFIEYTYELLNHGLTIKEVLENILNQKQLHEVHFETQKILDLLENGYSFYEACTQIKIFKKKFFENILIILQYSGKITLALKLAINNLHIKEKFVKNLLKILPYPIFIISLLFCAVAWLCIKGLYLFQSTGLYGTDLTIKIIQTEGIKILFFLSFISFAFFILIWCVLKKSINKYSFWASFDLLINAEIHYIDCINIITKDYPSYKDLFIPPFNKKFTNNNLFDTQSKILFLAGINNGNYKKSINQISTYQLKKMNELFDFLEKMIEPITTLITGISLLLIVQSILIPLLSPGVLL